MALLRLPESLSSLTTLKKLILDDGPHYTQSLEPIMGLPQLEHLDIYITNDEFDYVAGLPLQSSCLTKLEVHGNFDSKIFFSGSLLVHTST